MNNPNPGTGQPEQAFRLALQYAFLTLLIDLCKRDDHCDDMDDFYELALIELGFAGRPIDAQLIAEAIPKLRERGVDYDHMVEIVVEEAASVAC
jgi:hypothetical protein